MNRTYRAARSVLFTAALFAAGSCAWAAVGTVEFVDGDAQIVAQSGEKRVVRNSTAIDEGDTVSTGLTAEVHIRMADQMLIAVRPNTRVRIDSYRAAGDDGDNATLSLLKGTLRAVSGWIGRYNRAHYAMLTPTATIGIRGTDHEPAYFGTDTSASERANLTLGTYDKVNLGETFIKNAKGEIAILPGHAGFAAHDATVPPAQLDKLPGFYRRTKNEDAFETKRDAQSKLLDAKRAEAQEKAKAASEKKSEETEKKTARRRATLKKEAH